MKSIRSFAALLLLSCTSHHAIQHPPPHLALPAEAADDEAQFLTNIRQLTFAGHRSGEGYFSADGKQLVFQSERNPDNPFYQIYLLDLTNGITRMISKGVGKTTCGWIHPSNRWILFSSTHLDPQARDKQIAELADRAAGKQKRYSWEFDDRYDLFRYDLKQNELIQLTDTLGYDAEASYSPDGTEILFASNRSAYDRPLSSDEAARFNRDSSYFVDLYLLNADGSSIRRLTDSPGYDGGPFFSSDGKKIVWRRFSTDGMSAEIWTMNRDGSNQRQITQLGVISWAPFFDPSGEIIVFASNLLGSKNFELYAVDRDGKAKPIRITHSDGFDGLPAFSPDGQTLSWSSSRGGDHRVQLFSAEWNDHAIRAKLKLPPRSTPLRPASPTPPTLTELRNHVAMLASEAMEGRATGTEGERLATHYVADRFREIGLTPNGDDQTYFQEFSFTSGVTLGKENHLWINGLNLPDLPTLDQDWRPLAFSASGAVDAAPVVFVGYGLMAPEGGGGPAVNDYGDIDLSGKWAMMFRFIPEEVSPERRQHLARYGGLRYKAMVARDRGARGLIVVSGPTSNANEPLVPLRSDVALARSSLAAISISDGLAEALLAKSGQKLRTLQLLRDSGQSVAPIELNDLSVTAKIDLQQERKKGHNVAGLLSVGKKPTAQRLVVGAHLDHLGRGKSSNSRAAGIEASDIHFGADDNASGTSALIVIAKELMEKKKRGELRGPYDIEFVAFSGEETGLFGSNRFTQDLPDRSRALPPTKRPFAAYLNMDMIGRLRGTAIFQGVGSSSVWPELIEQANAALGLPLATQADSYLPTDTTSFYLKGVPILNAFTGAHADYHTPDDTIDKINFDGIARIADLMRELIVRFESLPVAPDYIEIEDKRQGGGSGSLRAYLGTIPDYSDTDLSGVRLSGVSSNGPAAKAGIRGGDIVIHVAGRKIENIYDYTYALEALKIGRPVPMTLLRDGKKVTVTVIPTSRE